MNKQEKQFITAAGILIFAGIILGALGAHALKNIISETAIQSFKTGVFYQISQGLGLLLLVLIQKSFNLNLKLSLRLILLGTILFSCSIFTLSLMENIEFSIMKKILGPVTPLGGLLMIAGWMTFIMKALKSPSKP